MKKADDSKRTGKTVSVACLIAVGAAGFWAVEKYAPFRFAQPVTIAVCLAVAGVGALGALWMIWAALRGQQKPFTMVVIAMFIPYAFVWYYSKRAGEFERAQLRRVVTIAVVGSVMVGGFVLLSNLLNAG